MYVKSDPQKCWEWKGCLNKFGHGQFYYKGKVRRAHRVAWEIFYKTLIPEGKHCLHRCDNPKCVNPDHLFLGTHLDNIQDMVNKGRSSKRPGELNPNATLSESQVVEIFKSYGKLKMKELSEIYKVSIQAIHSIVRGKTWKHLKLIK